ncbi:NADPH:quinone oxidoreductase family protein [Maribacter sp. 2307ULW6-5]|uniref:NADPH:quinone oxidoreductase family protein n=1 Tax=Maribacter sp. 2307ULW6-5 TaxID=3386275 RepID=UPI0039BC5FAA
MRAIRCNTYGPPSTLALETVPEPVPGEMEVLVQVKACGVNFPDTLIIQGKYQFKPQLPFTPGSDLAGIVKAVGPGVSHLQVDDEVFGFVAHGAMAEAVLVPAKACFLKPRGMSFPIAASFLMAYGTSFHALKDRGKLQAGETLLVLGAAGGVGLAAVELGKLMGARVIAAASSKEKLDLCKKHGADQTMNYGVQDIKATLKELTQNKGVDVVYDPVGGNFSEAAFRAMGWNGRHLVVGFAAGEIPKLPLNLPLLKGASVVGVFWGAFAMKFPKENLANTKTLMQWQADEKLKPHIHATYPLRNAPEALEEMMQRKVSGKLVIEM